MRLPRYAEYKESGVQWLGTVPKHWHILRLKSRVALRTEKTDRRSNPVGLENIESGSGRFVATHSEFEGEGVAFEPGDLLFGKLRPYLAKVHLAETSGEAVGDFHVLRPAQSLNGRFAQYVMLNRSFIDVVDGSTFGSKMPRASWETLGAMPFLCPTAEEQGAIAAFLDTETGKIDALIAEQEKLIALLSEKRQATISHAVTRGLNPDAPMKDSGVAWLGEVPAHWKIMGLTRALHSVVDYRGRTPTKVDEGVFLVTARNIRNGKIDYEASQEFIDPREFEDIMRRGIPAIGDVLFTTEAPLGQVALVDREDIALAQRIIKFRAAPHRLTNAFLKAWLMGSACQFNLEQLATGSTALGIKGSKVGQVRLCLPPLEEQEDIVRHVEVEAGKLDALRVQAESAIGLLKERRSALIAAAVTGQIDVRGAVSAEARSLDPEPATPAMA